MAWPSEWPIRHGGYSNGPSMRGKEFSRRTASESDSIFIRKMLIEFPDGQRGPFETKISI